MTARRKRIALASVLSAWAVAAVGGMGLLMASSRVPDVAAAASPTRPAAAQPTTNDGGPSLVVCLHPRCPCSDATLDAVETLLAAAPGADVTALFAVPDPQRPGWDDTALVERARRIRGLEVVIDVGGMKCAALGARTSGQAFLYGVDGRLSFSGGLTPGRGEIGATAGAARVARVLAGETDPAPLHTDVFGCALYRASTLKAAP